MAVINILKDGTVVDDMSKITVPKEIMVNIYNIYHSETLKDKKKEVKKNGL